MKSKIIIYNPYVFRGLFTLFSNYSVLSRSFGKGALLKKIIGQSFFYRFRSFSGRYTKVGDKTLSMFNYIEIETINRCNSTCGFCPVNKKNDIRTFAQMNSILYEKIINELSSINYTGRLAFHSNNEPLLDENLEQRITYARLKCPKAYIYFYTNGTLLTTEKVMAFKKAGIDKIVVNNYNDKLKVNKNIISIVNELKKLPDSTYPLLVVVVRKLNEVLHNRAGAAPNKKIEDNVNYRFFAKKSCPLPFNEMVIRPDGKISLCCSDTYGQMTMGDANTQSLSDIWYGAAFAEVRKKLSSDGRKAVSLCSTCDK